MLHKCRVWITGSLRTKATVLITSVMTMSLAVFVVYDALAQKQVLEEALLQQGKNMALSAAASFSHVLEDAIASGRLTEAEVFDTNHQPIPGTNPQKYHTAYDSFTDANLLKIEDAYLSDTVVLYVIASDVNGYVPTHNTRYTNPLTGDYATDLDGNRTKRIYDDSVAQQVAQNTQPVLHQIYTRDTGELSWDISAPIWVNGKHWGGARVGFSLERINAQVTTSLQHTITGALLLTVVIGMAAFFIARSIARPVMAISHAAVRLAEGDVAQEIAVNQSDEIGRLAEAFRRMIAYLQEMADAAGRLAQGDLTVEVTPRSTQDALGNAFVRMVADLRSLVGQVANSAMNVGAAAGQLSASADQSAQAAQQVASTIQQVAAGTSQQTESVTRATAVVEGVTQAIDGVARGAQEQATAVGKSAEIAASISTVIQQVAANAQAGAEGAAQTTYAARKGTETVEKTIKGMESIKTSSDLVAQRVREMGQRSEQIGVIVETIDDIASQTNLLALNAAIEAARAGEHGKGFAVVADEVRKLAESATAATKEIAALIKTIQQTIGEAVQAMDAGTTQVEAGMTQADEAGQALNSILAAAEAVNRQVEEIAAAAQQMDASANELVGAMDAVSAVVEENTASTEEMAAGASEVSQAIENIAAISEENSAATEEVSATVEEMAAQVEEVTASAQSLSAMAQELQTLVTQFKLPGVGDTRKQVDAASLTGTIRATVPRTVGTAPVASPGGDGHGYEKLEV
jgi:methyl-accepting chemotaxis protein